MFYLVDVKKEENPFERSFKSDNESDDFKYQVGDTVYRITDDLIFRIFKVEGRWIGSTSHRRSRYDKRKAYKVRVDGSPYSQSQYETAIFRTKEEAISNRFEKERKRAAVNGSTARLRRLERLQHSLPN
jgi:hypothetical protein